MKRGSKTPSERALEVVWSAWAEMGVAGWKSRAFPLAIDPEALVLWTGCLGDADPRLRDEALDWCISYSTLISRSRLRRMLDIWPVSASWSSFAATLEAKTGQEWPGSGKPLRFEASGKSELHAEGRPALLALRLRGLFGTTARAELLRVLLLAPPERRWSIAELTTEACYTKGNISEALGNLSTGGAVESTREGNALRFRLRHRADLAALAAPLPSSRDSFLWRALITWRLTAHIDEFATASATVRHVESAKLLAALAPTLSRAGWSSDVGLVAESADPIANVLTHALVALN